MSLFLRLLRISLWQYCRNNVVKSVWFGKKKINREGGFKPSAHYGFCKNHDALPKYFVF